MKPLRSHKGLSLNKKFASLVLILFCLQILLSTTLTRINALFDLQNGISLVTAFFWLVSGVSSAWLITKQLRTYSLILGVLFLVGFCSFAQIYWPSLRLGVPVQDYLLHDQISSNYSFDSAKIYLRNCFFAIVPGLAAAQALHYVVPSLQRVIFVFLGVCAFINFIVFAIQTHINLNWLSLGSGTAVSAQRAPGLLEDSGASTVFSSAVVVGLFFTILFSRLRFQSRIISLLVFICALFAGAGTGGRIYFVAVSAGIVAGTSLWLYQLFRSRQRDIWLAPGIVFISGVVVILYMLSPRERLQKIIPNVEASSDSFVIWLNQWLLGIDEIRAVHIKTMVKAFLEHPWIGTGLGTFYANYQQHLEWALSTGGSVFADPPASMYFMLISELGMIGIILGVLLIASLIRSYRDILQIHQKFPNRQDLSIHHSLLCFASGSLTALCVSFGVGIHVIFLSITSLIAIIVFGLSLPRSHENKLSYSAYNRLLSRFSTTGLSLIGLLLCAEAVYMLVSAPRSPAFRWSLRGKPQKPLSLIVPIDTQGKKGLWVASGAELLFEGKPIQLLIEAPSEYYPLTIKLTLLNSRGVPIEYLEHTVAKYDAVQPWQIQTFEFTKFQSCPKHPSPQEFCSYRLESRPVWVWDGQQIGAFVIGSNT